MTNVNMFKNTADISINVKRHSDADALMDNLINQRVNWLGDYSVFNKVLTISVYQNNWDSIDIAVDEALWAISQAEKNLNLN